MWKSVSTAFTLVVLVAAEAAVAGSTVAATVAPAASASPASEREAIRAVKVGMECMVILCGRCCSDVTVVNTGHPTAGI
jgi:hypothetical protein